MSLLPEHTRELWHAAAKAGTTPPVVDIARKQYGLMAPWYIRKHIWEPIQKIGTYKGKELRGRNLSRDHGKSIGVGVGVLAAAEYIIPYIPRLRHENRRIGVIARDEKHLEQENMDTLEDLICHHAPWLKTLDTTLWNEPEALKEFKLKTRTWNLKQKDLTNGVSIRGFAFSQSVRGGHYPFWVLDDFIDDEDAHFGDKHYNRITSAIVPATVKGGLIMAVGTPIDDNDVWSHIEKEPAWQFKKFPAMDTGQTNAEGVRLYNYREMNEQDLDDGYLPVDAIKSVEDFSCLWPYRLNFSDLQQMRGTQPKTELVFLREFMMERSAAWNLLVNPEYYRQAKRHDVSYQFTVTDGHTFMGVDPSTLRRSNFVIWVGTKLRVKTGQREYDVIRPLYRKKIEVNANEDPQIKKQRTLQAIDEIRVCFQRYNPKKVVIEGNGFQNVIEPLLTEKDGRMKGRIETIDLTSNKHFDDGWPIIRTVFEAGQVEMPYGPTPNEQVQIDAGTLDPHNTEARRTTDDFWQELQSVRYVEARILENENQPQDSVAAFYFLLRAAEYVPVSASVSGIPLERQDVVLSQAAFPRRVDPEFASRVIRNDAFSKLQRAQRLSRR